MDHTPAQLDGLACIICDRDYLISSTPHVPVGRSATGSQVFACFTCDVPHVMPEDDLIEHADSGDCTCVPYPVMTELGFTYMLHSALDGRELSDD
jgi:hypothetical protein